jgi:hypothetical protein
MCVPSWKHASVSPIFCFVPLFPLTLRFFLEPHSFDVCGLTGNCVQSIWAMFSTGWVPRGRRLCQHTNEIDVPKEKRFMESVYAQCSLCECLTFVSTADAYVCNTMRLPTTPRRLIRQTSFWLPSNKQCKKMLTLAVSSRVMIIAFRHLLCGW